jgi:ABC-type sugar transport system substrate-binding protein
MRRVALLLSDENNPYQRQLVREAQAAAGADIELLAPRFAGGLGINQIPQIFEAMRATPRVDAILIMMVVGEGLEKTIEKVVREGIACVFLNRMPAFLARLRALRAGTLVGTVTPDQRRIGAIQAEQCLALCPNGGFALLVLGTRSTASAIERREGFVNAIKRRLEVHDLEGDWTQAGAENALRDWYRLGADRRRTVDIIVCQNDSMAEGVRRPARAGSGAREAPCHCRHCPHAPHHTRGGAAAEGSLGRSRDAE